MKVTKRVCWDDPALRVPSEDGVVKLADNCKKLSIFPCKNKNTVNDMPMLGLRSDSRLL